MARFYTSDLSPLNSKMIYALYKKIFARSRKTIPERSVETFAFAVLKQQEKTLQDVEHRRSERSQIIN